MTIDDYLKLHGITAAKFAEKIGISEASLSRIRRGEQNITRDLMRQIIEASEGKIGAEALIFSAPADQADAA